MSPDNPPTADTPDRLSRGIDALAVLEATSDGVFVLDRDWRFVYLNPRAVGRIGDGRDLLGASIWEVLPEMGGSTFEESCRRALAEHISFRCEYLDPASSAWFEASAHPFSEGLIVYFREITDRRRHEAALQESESRFRRLADSVPVLIWMSGPDKAGVYFNKTWLDFTGRPLERELGDGWIELVHPDDLPALGACATAFAARQPFQTDFRLRRRDGEWRWMLDTGIPRFAPDGSFAGYIGSCIDITERKRAEDELRYQLELVRTITDNAASGLVLMDKRGHPTFMNPALERMTGLKLDDIKKAPLHHALHHNYPDGRPFPMEDSPIDKSAETLLPIRDHEDVFIRKDGTFFPVSCNVAPLEREGETVGAVIEIRDITERRRAEERQRLLINELNHRVKNTLSTVQALAVQTLRTTASPEAFRAAFEARLIALSDAHSILTRSNWTDAELRDLLEHALAPYRGGQASPARVGLQGGAVRLPPRTALTLGMAFHELATNAAKHGALSASTGSVQTAWRVEDADRGASLRLEWREAGGPHVERPTRLGFGLRLIERSIENDLDGEVRLDFHSDGVRCAMIIPLAARAGEPE
jgi:PAS domain S-box-containing protein